jgi:hypothetical protein
MVLPMENITPPMPAKCALAALDQPVPADVGPPKRISKKVRAAIDALVSGDCKKICDAAAKVGLARESLSRVLSTPHVAEYRRRDILPNTSQAQVARFLKTSLLEPSRAPSLSLPQCKGPTKTMPPCDWPLRLFHDDAISFRRLAHHLVCLRSSPLAFQLEDNAIASPDFDIVILNQTFSAHDGFTIVSANEFFELDTPSVFRHPA